MENRKRSSSWQHGSKRATTLFFRGAGTSTESGIPDFRSAPDYTRASTNLRIRRRSCSATLFHETSGSVLRLLPKQDASPHAPNGCHRLLSRLEHDGKLKSVITQNIDGLHQTAGCSEVLELHGSVHRNCMDCSRFYSLQDILDIKETVPRKIAEDWCVRTSCCMKRNWIRTSSCARSRKYRRQIC